MSRRKKEPLRPLTEGERGALAQMSRSQAAPAAEVTRAKLLLLVASGSDYQGAARAVGRKSGDAVSALVGRFNREGPAALTPRHGGGRRRAYGEAARARILAEAQRAHPTAGRHRHLVLVGAKAGAARGRGRAAQRVHLYHLGSAS